MDTVLFHNMIPDRPELSLALGTSNMLPNSAFRKPRQPSRTRLGLPITIDAHGMNATVLACADTGAEVNVMSDDLARSLGFQYETNAERKEFMMANGQVVESIGQCFAPCSFGVEMDVTVAMSCMFYVLQQVASPIIMGMAFLEKTKTMTEHRERLVRVPRPVFQALSVRAMDRPRQLLVCGLNEKAILATLDSGSEIDLISPRFALEHGYEVLPGEYAIELADGSIAMTSGFASVTLSVSSPNSSLSAHKSQTTTDFYLLKNLFHDVIVGEDSQTELEIFTRHQHAIVPSSDVFGPLGLNLIRLLGPADRMLSWIRNRFRREQGLSEGWNSIIP
jgi:hypothetical protein